MERVNKNVRINEIETMFLQHVFGPEFAFHFSGLTAQLPVKDYTDSNRFIDFYYESGPVRLIIEIDGYRYHVEGITTQQYDDHQERQNDLIISGGWMMVRFTAGMILKKPMLCRRQLMQAVGKSLVISGRDNISNPEQLWLKKKGEIVAIASLKGAVRATRIAKRYGIDRKTASRWLKRMVTEGDLAAIYSNRYVTGYIPPDQKQEKD